MILHDVAQDHQCGGDVKDVSDVDDVRNINNVPKTLTLPKDILKIIASPRVRQVLKHAHQMERMNLTQITSLPPGHSPPPSDVGNSTPD
jgi:hypothetical protein